METKNKTTALYKNRIADKNELELKLSLEEFGDNTTEFYIPNGPMISLGFQRIVYGDHGAYVEFNKSNIKIKLKSFFNNSININELPSIESSKYYYYWLFPEDHKEFKVYLQIKPVSDLPNAPKREDRKKSRFNRKEGYADYKRGFYYINPYDMQIVKK